MVEDRCTWSSADDCSEGWETSRDGLGRVQLEAIALGFLAVAPVLPYLAFILWTGVPRFGLFGDFALLEHAVRHVWTGDTLLGPYSRFRWSPPGPLFFYFAAPFQALFGASSTGLYVATCVVNAGASATIVSSVRLFARRSHAIAALVVVLTWFVAFGNVAANPWNPFIVVLPLMAFLVTSAMFARGRIGAVYPAVVFGALVAQHHVAAVSTVLVSGVVALIAFLVGTHRRGGLVREVGWRLVLAAAVLVVLFLPPLTEQLTAPVGNLTKLWLFFAHRETPLEPIAAATRLWATATSWLPERVISHSLIDEGYIPLVMRWDPTPKDIATSGTIIAVVHVAAIAASAFVAARRRDLASLSLLCFGASANVLSVTALRAIVGESYCYLVFWTTAGSSVAWIGVFSALFDALGTIAMRSPAPNRFLARPLAVAGLLATGATTSIQHYWLAEDPTAPASRPLERDDFRAIHGALRERLAHDGSTAVIHPEGAWDLAHAMVLELEKDNVDVRVSERDHWNYFGVRSDKGLERPLHVYFSTTRLPLTSASLGLAPQQPAEVGLRPASSCLELIMKSGDISMFGSPLEASSCGAPSAPPAP